MKRRNKFKEWLKANQKGILIGGLIGLVITLFFPFGILNFASQILLGKIELLSTFGLLVMGVINISLYGLVGALINSLFK